MPFKPVGVNERNQFPPRIMDELSKTFVTKPNNIENGQIPIWDSTTNTWRAGSPISSAPTRIDGGSPTER